MAIDVASERAQGAALTDKEVIARFRAILIEVVEIKQDDILAHIPLANGKKKTCPLRRKRGDDSVRSWAMVEYANRYPDDKKPSVANYEDARADIWLQADIAESEPPAQDKQEKRRPKSKLSEEDNQALYILRTFNDWQEDGPYPGSLFVRVPYITDTRGLDVGETARLARRYTGMWYLAGQEKPPTQLIDAALYYQDVTYPHSSAKNKPHTGNLRAVNGRGQSKLFPFTGNELRDRENNKFKSFAKWPQDIPTQARLLNAMEALFTGDPATIWHEQVDTLGYVDMPSQGGLAYVLANGIETERGFILNEQAPVIGPELICPGNGYQGSEEKQKPSDEIFKLIFDCAEEDQIRIAAKLGAMSYTFFPPGTVEQAGRLPFYMETVGSSGSGKTPEDNILKSLQGVGFRYDSPPYLTLDDTRASAPARMQIMKHLAYSDDDRKSSPGSPSFAGEHSARKRHINYYADGQGAGSRYYDHATRIASRGEPQGLALGTSNYDHAIYALSTPGLDEDPVEYRACTFVVPAGHEIRTEENSRAIFARRAEVYAIGRAFRSWLLHLYNQDRAQLREYLQDMGARAGEVMRESFDYPWEETKQKNHCRVLVWGLLAWIDFLKQYGPGREQGYLYQKLLDLLPGVVEDRAIRSNYLAELIKARDNGADLADFVLQAIRNTLAQARAHIVDQRGEPLALDDIPPDYDLSALGYFTRPVLGASTDDPDYVWDHPHVVLGHYMKRSRAIAFRMDALYSVALMPYAREQKYSLPMQGEMKKRLLDAGTLTEKAEWIKGKSDRYLSISLDALDLPGRGLVDEEEEAEKRDLLEQVANVVDLETRRAEHSGSPAPAQDAQAVNGREPPAHLKITRVTDESNIFDFDPYA